MELSALSVPVRTMKGGAPVGMTSGGCDTWMSFDTIMRPVPTSHKRSQEPDDSKMGFVTPAMYAGLPVQAKSDERRPKSKSQLPRLQKLDLHRLPFLPIRQVRIRESTFNKPAEDGATSRPKGARGQHVARDLTGRPIVPQENYPFTSDKGVEQDDDGMCKAAISVQVRVEWPSGRGNRVRERLYELDEGVLSNMSVYAT